MCIRDRAPGDGGTAEGGGASNPNGGGGASGGGGSGGSGGDGGAGGGSGGSLTSIEHERAGLNCEWGGDVELSGFDADQDSVLDPEEITQTTYDCFVPPTCNQVLLGNFTIQNGIDLAQLSNYCEVTGDLIIATGASIPVLEIPTIERVGVLWTGELLGIFASFSVSLPSLRDVIGLNAFSDGSLDVTSLSWGNNLGLGAAATGDVVFEHLESGSPYLELYPVGAGAIEVHLPKWVGSWINVRGPVSALHTPQSTSLQTVSLRPDPAGTTLVAQDLTHVGDLRIFGAPGTAISLPNLVEVSGSVAPITCGDALPAAACISAESSSVLLPALALVEGGLSMAGAGPTELTLPALVTIDNLSVVEVDSLAFISAPVLQTVTETLQLRWSNQITTLDLPSLTSAGCIDVRNNFSLPSCDVADLIAQTGTACSQNSGNASCP